MHRHMIILSSSYTEKTRIAIDCVDDLPKFTKYVDMVCQAYDGKRVLFSTHGLTTDSPEWSSIVAMDPYFQDVRLIQDIDQFIRLIQKERYLTGEIVARYILSKQRCTHTRLEKLTYLAYADFISETGTRLFEDEIYAFDYGPVIKSVYSKYSPDSKQHPSEYITDTSEIEYSGSEMSIKSRIIFAEDGLKKQFSIDKTLQRYREFSTEELIDITHREGSPWKHIYSKEEVYQKIPDEFIIQYHRFENP
ncbi:MAG: DUF4065 domain-containing protein [archaeon]|nr:DUF4065 domain-containing protein [archaeon]